MKHIKLILSLALVIVSIFAIALPASAATNVSVSWVSAKAKGDLGGVVSCMYSQMTESSSYIVRAFHEPTTIQVKFDTNKLKWASVKYGSETGYIPVHHIDISTDNLRIGMFSSSTLRRGFEGKPVENLQRCLVSLGYDTNGIDGVYGAGTEDAVTKFQRKYSLLVDGVAGKDTKVKLLSECDML